MHELSIAQGIIEIVDETARAHGIRAVRRVHVRIGELAGIDPEALYFAWESVTREGIARGSKLEIERTPGQAWCTDCGKTVPLKRYGDACPDCGGSLPTAEPKCASSTSFLMRNLRIIFKEYTLCA